MFLLKVLSHKKTCLVILLLGNNINLFQNLIIATFLRTQLGVRSRILVQVTINRRLLIGRDGHLDQSEAYDLS